MKVEFKLNQKATQVPARNVFNYRVTEDDGELFVELPDGWISIDMEDKTFAVGAYEG